MIVVVPVVQIAEFVGRLLERVHVDLAAEPEELLEDARVVADARAVLAAVADVLQRRVRRDLRRQLERAAQDARHLLQATCSGCMPLVFSAPIERRAFARSMPPLNAA